MSTIIKRIRAAGIARLIGTSLTSLAQAVFSGMNGNLAYPTPPVALSVLSAGITSYIAALAAALDGGKTALHARDVEQASLIHTLQALARYVELNCGDNMTTFMSSGFPALSTTRPAPQPLAPASIDRIDPGPISGQAKPVVKPVAKAKRYDLRFGPVLAGVPPTTWTTLTFTTAKKAPPVTGLTPGTTYTFEVRALGSLGYTDWSNPVTCVCT